MILQPNFIVDTENFILLQEEIELGKIKQLSLVDTAALAPHIQKHPETLYVACSGVNLSTEFGIFRKGGQQIAIEWVRYETNPNHGEPECNVYRYLFGEARDGTVVGIDVTKRPKTGQVAEHWTTFDDAVKRHSSDIHFF